MISVYLFHAEWCHNCPIAEKVFEEIKSELDSDDVRFNSVDVESDEGVDLSCLYQVRNVPTMIIVKNKRVVERVSGTRSKNEIKQIIEKWK